MTYQHGRSAAHAIALLNVQRACWRYGRGGYASPQDALHHAGQVLEESSIDAAAAKATAWDRRATAAIAIWILSVVLLAGQLAVLAAATGHALLTGQSVMDSIRVILISGGVTLLAAAVTLTVTVISEQRCLAADRNVMRLGETQRLCKISWELVDVDQLPASMLELSRRYPYMQERLWTAFDGVDRHAVEVLARESTLSVSQLRQAVSLLT